MGLRPLRQAAPQPGDGHRPAHGFNRGENGNEWFQTVLTVFPKKTIKMVHNQWITPEPTIKIVG